MHAINMLCALFNPSPLPSHTCRNMCQSGHIHSELVIKTTNSLACTLERKPIRTLLGSQAESPHILLYFVTLHSIYISFLRISIIQSEFFHENTLNTPRQFNYELQAFFA